MSSHVNHHDHDRVARELPLSLMAQSALTRVSAVTGVLVLLWLAVFWAVSLP